MTCDITAPAAGRITAIDNLTLARIARLAGAPMDKGAGVQLFRKLGESVKKGETLYRIYVRFRADFEFAMAQARRESGYEIGGADDVLPPWEEWS